MGFGFMSSSCSFAALSATRSLFVKGTHLITALAFMFAATNLVIELGILLWIFLSWHFVIGLYLGAFVLVGTMVLIVHVTYPERLVEQARERASQSEGMEMEPSQGLPAAWRERLRSSDAWRRVGSAFIGEWNMVWKELLAGFVVAGAVASLIPEGFFEAVFPAGLTLWLLILLHALLGPVLALLMTIIGSMGNGPLAAVHWQNGVLFGGIMAFLFADFVVLPSLKINANYYGWRFATYLGLVFAASAIIAGIVLHLLFSLVGLIPEPQRNIKELATFAVDYTFFLNLLAIAIAIILVWLSTSDIAARQEAAARETTP